MKSGKISPCDYIKANRRGRREAEIENHTRPVNFCRIHKSKKVYDRKKMKADDNRRLPSLFFLSDESYTGFLYLCSISFKEI